MKCHTDQTTRIFCENIRALRNDTGHSVTAMAKRLHTNPKTLTALERGTIPPRLSCEILFRLEEEFGIKPQDMLGEKNAKN